MKVFYKRPSTSRLYTRMHAKVKFTIFDMNSEFCEHYVNFPNNAWGYVILSKSTKHKVDYFAVLQV